VPSDDALILVRRALAKPPFWTRDIDDVRREYQLESARDCGLGEPMAEVSEIREDGIRARLYRPDNATGDILVWLHGGAWIIGNPDTDDSLTRALANRSCCSVLSVDYSLSPESRFPVAVGECWAAVQWAAERFEQVAVSGESAGGNLAAVIALHAREHDVPLALQLLVYPMLDYRIQSDSYRHYSDRYKMFAGVEGFGAGSREAIGHVWDGYVSDRDLLNSPEVSPLRAESFEGVAPALIITAEHDILREEAEEYARRLRAASVPVDLWDFKGQVHGFFRFVGTMADARGAVSESARVRRHPFDTRNHASPRV
jgi:acetyl esterase